jgi:ubiquitin carboxyl-terminal hydrolase 14
MVVVNVKWGKQKFEGVEVDVGEPVAVFKAQLFALTNVPPERQKVMGVKGGQLKDDADMSALGLKPNQNLMLMGTADALPEPPPEPTVFAEDLPAAELKAKEAVDAGRPGGLANLGNTCYLNSTLQCMKIIPELSTSLQKFSGAGAAQGKEFVFAMRDLMTQLDRANAAQEVTPISFVNVFRASFPAFAERMPNNGPWKQQDAQECWSTLVNALGQSMVVASAVDATSDLPSASPPLLPRMEALRAHLGDMLFGIETETQYKCVEIDDPALEAPTTRREAMRQISCHISATTAHLFTALEGALEEDIEKESPTLGRSAVYRKSSRIARLPPYLPVLFVRFAYRKDTEKRAKIVRPVSFPDVLDARNLCTEKLQRAINAHCKQFYAELGARGGRRSDGLGGGAGGDGGGRGVRQQDGAVRALRHHLARGAHGRGRPLHRVGEEERQNVVRLRRRDGGRGAGRADQGAPRRHGRRADRVHVPLPQDGQAEARRRARREEEEVSWSDVRGRARARGAGEYPWLRFYTVP